MHRHAWFVVLALVVGVLIGALGLSIWPGNAQAPGGPEASSAESSVPEIRQLPLSESDRAHLAEVVESLTQVLNDEINERRVLTEQLEQLESELSDLEQNLSVRVREAFAADEASRQRSSGDRVAQSSWDERLAAAGFTPQQLESIRTLQSQGQMAHIELDDRARREGWINTPRYMQESRNLQTGATAVRNALGDELYDRYLTASGLTNRLAVASIIESSPAEAAGFQPGDIIVRYGGERVFSTEQLINLRSSGEHGEPVAVEIRRSGQLLQLTIPRGPMGIATQPARFDPATPEG
jgi:C-terminal processing protease CtpA/Prc